MRKKLPTLNVHGCYDCPFALGDTSTYRCTFPHKNATHFSMRKDVKQYVMSDGFPMYCPGKEFDLAVEFPDE